MLIDDTEYGSGIRNAVGAPQEPDIRYMSTAVLRRALLYFWTVTEQFVLIDVLVLIKYFFFLQKSL